MTLSFNKLFNYKDHLAGRLLSFLCTWHMQFICFLKNIKLGENCQFHGLAKFKRSETGRIQVGANCTFGSSSYFSLMINKPCILAATEKNANITIGSNCGFSGITIACAENIRIGNNVRCGANILITDSDWHTEDIRSGGSKPVFIGDDVWLGANVVVLKGVTIGVNSVIAANSVVFNDIPKNCVAAGNPCVVVFDPSKKRKI